MAKTIRGLQTVLLNQKGEKYEGDPTIKDEVLEALFITQSEKPADAIRKQTKIIPHLNASKDAVTFEDSDYEIVKAAVEKNIKGWRDGVWGQILLIMVENVSNE
jgi:hypothetical protein